MAEQPTPRFSKEFQIKMREDAVISDEHARDTILAILEGIEESGRYDFKVDKDSGQVWERRGERYDTLPDVGVFIRHNLSLATEKRGEGDDARTKLKCKLHSFCPELLYRTVKKSWAYPEPGGYGDEVETKFKLEQDIHFNNTKFCATGYLTLPGRDHEFKKVADFLPYYPRLTKIEGVKGGQPLIKVRDWNEAVFDRIGMKLGDWEIEGALVTRRDHLTGAWDESEFSFKLRRPTVEGCELMNPAAGWDYHGLQTLAAIYDEMFKMDSVFIQDPSIFYFATPVGSTSIQRR